MRKIKFSEFKIIGSLLLLLFLSASAVLIANNVSKVREPASQAATRTITISANFDGDVLIVFEPHDAPSCSTNRSTLRVGQVSDDPDVDLGEYRIYIRFPLNALPSEAMVTDVDFKYRVVVDNNVGRDSWLLRAYSVGGTSDPAADPCGSRNGRIGGGHRYMSGTFPLSVGKHTVSLPENAETDVQAAKAAVNRFSLAISRLSGEEGVNKLEAIEDSGIDHPKLIITYTTPDPPPPPDTTAPSVPGNMRVTGKGSTWVRVDWSASRDNTGGSGLAGYKVYRNRSRITNTTATAHLSTSLSSSTTYSFYVRAYDRAGNTSNKSTTVSATTLPAGTGPPPPAPPIQPSQPISGPSSTKESNSVTSLTLKLNPLSELVGNKVIKVSVKGTKFSRDVTISPSTKEIKLGVPAGILKKKKVYTMQISADKLLIKKLKFRSLKASRSLKAGSLYLGDFDGDNIINKIDLESFLASFHATEFADLNIDGVVNSLDYSIVLKNQGKKGD